MAPTHGATWSDAAPIQIRLKAIQTTTDQKSQFPQSICGILAPRYFRLATIRSLVAPRLLVEITSYPFTAPNVRPRIMYRCIASAAIKVGTIPSPMAAHIGPH